MQRPPLRHRLHDPIVAALWALGAGLLALAALDYLAYDFAFIDLIAHEDRLLGATIRDDKSTPLGRGAVVLTGTAAVALLGAVLLQRIRPLARRLWKIAAVAVAALVPALVQASRHARGEVDSFEVHPIHAQLWQTARGDLTWRIGADQTFALILLTAAIPVLAIVALLVVRRPHTWRIALATAVPATITAGALTWLWCTYGHLAAVGHEAWVADVQAVRALLFAATLGLAALVLLVRTRPSLTPPSPAPPAALLVLGAAAVFLTTPHRTAIDRLYPLHTPLVQPLEFSRWAPRQPWDFDLPPARTCGPAVRNLEDLYIRLVADQPMLIHCTSDPMPIGSDTAHRVVDARSGPHKQFALIVDRRVPMTAVTRLLTYIPGATAHNFTVVGAETRTMLSADGPVITWTLCSLGRLQLSVLQTTTLAPDATWGDIVDDPTLVQP